MTQFVAFEKNIEVNGSTILSVVKGAGVFEASARKYLAKYGLDKVTDSADSWYPQQAWLDTFREIQTAVGPRTMFLIGKKIPESAVFPPQIKTVTDALAAIDVAYHMNHRKNGKPLFDGATGKMTEGIGHYVFKKTDDSSGVVDCQNPYPCQFDMGIVAAMAERFSPGSVVTHPADAPCRDRGAKSCAFTVKWKG